MSFELFVKFSTIVMGPLIKMVILAQNILIPFLFSRTVENGTDPGLSVGAGLQERVGPRLFSFTARRVGPGWAALVRAGTGWHGPAGMGRTAPGPI